MTSRDDRRRQLERLTHRALRELPMLRAPATLEARVLSRIERRAGGSASHQGFAQWPLGARVALVASSVASLAFVLFGLNALWTRFIWLPMEPTVERRLEELRRGGEAIASLASVGLHLVRMIPAEWLLAGLLATALLYAMLVLAVKAARQRPPAGGPQVAGTGAGSRATGHAPSGSAVPPSAAAASSWSGTQPPEPGTRPPGSDMPPPETGTQPPGTGAPSSGPDAPSGSQGGRNAPPVDPHIAATLPRAGFWIRMGALLLDLVLVGFALSLLYHGARGTLLILAVYAAIMWKVRGTTIGGIVFDLQVVRLDGRPIDWETAIVRALGCFLSLVILGLGFLWIAIDPERQAWHDKLAGTVVVRLAKGVALV